MADAELRQVWDDDRRLIEGEVRGELQAIGRDGGDPASGCSISRARTMVSW